MTRTAAYTPRPGRTGLPLVQVTCTRCGLVFTSGARSRTTCPDCGRDLRVHRGGRRRTVVTPRPRQQPGIAPRPVRQAPEPVRQAPPISPIPLTQPPPPADDGRAYTLLDGCLVLAEWRDGCVVAAAVLPADYLAGELHARGWALQPHGQGICQVVTRPGLWQDGGPVGQCPSLAQHSQPPVCELHFGTLRSPYIPARRRR